MRTLKMLGLSVLVTFISSNLFAAEVVVKTAPTLTVKEPATTTTVKEPVTAPSVQPVVSPVGVKDSFDPGTSVKAPSVSLPSEPSVGVSVKEPALAPTISEPVLAAPTIKSPMVPSTIKTPIAEPIVKVPIVAPQIREPAHRTPVLKTPSAPMQVKVPATAVKVREPASRPAMQVRQPATGQPRGVAPGHAYTPIGTTTDASGKENVVLRNPWGNAETGSSSSDAANAVGDSYFLAALSSLTVPDTVDANSMIMDVMKGSYVEASRDLQDFADKVSALNDAKKAAREYLRDVQADQEMNIDESMFEPLEVGSKESLSYLALITLAKAAVSDAQQMKSLLQSAQEQKVQGKKNEIDRMADKQAAERDAAWSRMSQSVSTAVVAATSGAHPAVKGGGSGGEDNQQEEQPLKALASLSKQISDSAIAVVRKADDDSGSNQDSDNNSVGGMKIGSHNSSGLLTGQSNQSNAASKTGEQKQKKKQAGNALDVGFVRDIDTRAGQDMKAVLVEGNPDEVLDFLVKFSSGVNPDIQKRAYMERKLVEMNEVERSMVSHLNNLGRQFTNSEPPRVLEPRKLEPKNMSYEELRKTYLKECAAFEAVRNKRQMATTAFQNFDQKANQLYNLLSSVMKAMNEMRMGAVRNML